MDGSTNGNKAVEKVKSQAVTKGRPKTILEMLDDPKFKLALAEALPSFMTKERFARIVATQFRKVPKLTQCTPASLFSCVLDCAQLGLEPDGRKAHLIPYGDTCTLIVDYKGLVALARRSGEISDIHADIVCKNDKFEYSFGTTGTLEHKPNLEDRGEVIAAYSFAKLKDGSCSYEVMSVQEINAIRNRSKAGKSGPWVTDWNEMAKKTVFRRHSKWLPVSTDFQEAVDKDFDVPVDITPLPQGASGQDPASSHAQILAPGEKPATTALPEEFQGQDPSREPGAEG
jgi:recombination protein RecT